MKKQLVQIALGMALLTPFSFFSQEGKIQPCNTYAAMEEYFNANPGSRENFEANQKILREAAQQSQNMTAKAPSAVVYTIPVVFHILHVGGGENITDAQCVSALAQVNRDYARQGADVGTIATPFQSSYINTNFTFMLARKDPNGNCTTGIEHVYSVKTDWNQSDLSFYNGITWDPTKYLNVIIVKQIIPTGTVTGGGIIVGYTHLPGTVNTGSSADAIVYNFNYLGGLQARSLSHEIGHWFNLNHTFGNTNNPGVVCGDDGLSDTPPTKGAFGTCPSSYNGNACAAVTTTAYTAYQTNVENFMDYSGCPKNFTTDQTNAMRAAIISNVGNRQNVWQSANLIATDVNGTSPCAPIAEFLSANNSYTVCAGESLSMIDFSYNGSITAYVYTAGNGAIVSGANTPSPTVMFPTPGTTTVHLVVSNAQGTGSKTRTVYVMDATPGMVGPAQESFEGLDVPPGWAVINPNLGSNTWTQTFNAYAYDGAACMMIDASSIAGGQQDILQTPVIDMSTTPGAPVTFAVSYAQKTAAYNDQLQIQASNDCGGTWVNIHSYAGFQMQANTGGVTANSFTPSVPQEWAVDTLSNYPPWTSNAFDSSPNVMIRFIFVESTQGSGNNIYIDAVNIVAAPNGLNELSRSIRLGLYPNPTSAEAHLKFQLSSPSAVTVRIVDVLGRDAVSPLIETMPTGEQNVILNKDNTLGKGIYFVNMNLNGTQISKKLVIQ